MCGIKNYTGVPVEFSMEKIPSLEKIYTGKSKNVKTAKMRFEKPSRRNIKQLQCVHTKTGLVKKTHWLIMRSRVFSTDGKGLQCNLFRVFNLGF